MPEAFPKILVATECPPNSAGGGAAVIRQMLKDWPADRLFWWSCFPDRDRLFGREVATHRVARIPHKLYPRRRWRRQKSWLLEKIWTPWATRHFQKTLMDLEPEVVWVIPHGWSIPPLSGVLPQSDIGFHVSVHDYADLRGTIAWFGPERSRRLAGLADDLYSRAVTRDAICQPMVDDLKARTGADGTVAHAGLESADFEFLKLPPSAIGDEIRIAYAGTILVEKEFELFVQALERVRSHLPAPAKMDFFGDHSYRLRKWFDPAWMREHGNLPAARLSEALRECTWGFAPMGLTDEDPRYNRFSLPTKFVSYLAAGLPIITLGHPESSVVKVARSHAVGICITSGDLEKLSSELLNALSDSNPRLKYRPGIQRCAELEFDARRMRTVLYESFQLGAVRTRTIKGTA